MSISTKVNFYIKYMLFQNYIKQQIEEKQRLKQHELDKELDLENVQVQPVEYSSQTATEPTRNDPQEIPISELKQVAYFYLYID